MNKIENGLIVWFAGKLASLPSGKGEEGQGRQGEGEREGGGEGEEEEEDQAGDAQWPGTLFTRIKLGNKEFKILKSESRIKMPV